MDVMSIGEMVIDFLPGKELNSFIANPGGAPANAAIAVARNGLSVGFIGKVGNDNFGKMLVGTLTQENVTIPNQIMTDKAITTMAFVHLDEHKERSFTFARKPGADMFLDIEDVKQEYIQDATIIHAGSCSLSSQPAASATKYAMSLGKKLGKMISFDLNYRNLLWDDDLDAAIKAILEVLPLVDLLKISDEERFILSPFDSVFEFMNHYHITLVVETLGKYGAAYYYKGKRVARSIYDGPRVDTTGAGDAFWGGFLSSLLLDGVDSVGGLNEVLLEKALIRGNVAGGLCVREKGAISSLPRKEELEIAIKEYLNEEKTV
jgi:sugar/nucleoside kinase (ribokinase family)